MMSLFLLRDGLLSHPDRFSSRVAVYDGIRIVSGDEIIFKKPFRKGIVFLLSQPALSKPARMTQRSDDKGQYSRIDPDNMVALMPVAGPFRRKDGSGGGQ